MFNLESNSIHRPPIDEINELGVVLDSLIEDSQSTQENLDSCEDRKSFEPTKSEEQMFQVS